MKNTNEADLNLTHLYEGTIRKEISKTDTEGFALVSRGISGLDKGIFRERYRPQKFEEVVPTCSVKHLRNQLDNPNASQVFLFEGNSGTGKTTCARIMAKACVCLSEDTNQKPCLTCDSCKSYDRSFDKLEINAADKNKVDDARAFVEDMKTLPALYRKKIYILDEVQRLTKDAQQVLLTELEKPRPYLLVFLCTTNISDINQALIDRCCRVSFKDLTAEQAGSVVCQVAFHEKLEVTDKLTEDFFAQSGGSIRALLNNIQSFAEGGFDSDRVVDKEVEDGVNILYGLIVSGNWKGLSAFLKGSGVRYKSERLRVGLENYTRAILLNTEDIRKASKIGSVLLRMQGTLVNERNTSAMYNSFVVKCLRACCVFSSLT